MYRPPKLQATADTALYEEINFITENNEVIIIGDFNCPNVDCTVMHRDQKGNGHFEMVEELFITLIVTSPEDKTTSWIWCRLLTQIYYATAKLVKN